jgi:hypothetical protein
MTFHQETVDFIFKNHTVFKRAERHRKKTMAFAAVHIMSMLRLALDVIAFHPPLIAGKYER